MNEEFLVLDSIGSVSTMTEGSKLFGSGSQSVSFLHSYAYSLYTSSAYYFAVTLLPFFVFFVLTRRCREVAAKKQMIQDY